MTTRRSRLFAVALLLTALAGLGARGCFSRPTFVATLDTPASPAAGKLTVSFALEGGSGPASVSLAFSKDAGLSWTPATVAGPTSELAASPKTTHTLAWDSLADLGATKSEVALRLEAKSGGETSSALSGPFLADNEAGANRPPSLVVADPLGEDHAGALLPKASWFGHVLVTFTLADPEGDAASVVPEYSMDGGATWKPAASADGASLALLAAPKTGKSHTFLWDSKAATGATKAEALVRLTPHDTKPGAPGRTGYLLLDNVELKSERGPYLQLVTPAGILVVWTTVQRTTSSVAYGPGPELGSLAEKRESVTTHVVELSGLVPGAYYHYKASSSGAAVGGSKFRTTPPPGTPFTCVAFGDSGLTELLGVQEALGKAKAALEPDLLLHTGDVIYPGGEQERYTPNFFKPYRALLARSVAYLSLGNHDYKTASGGPYLENFHLPSNNPAKTERYYSFDYGDAHFVALDSNLSLLPDSPQGKWLEEDLAKTTQTWKVAFWHHPMYSSGRHGSTPGVKAALEAVLLKHGVDLVLVGHDHHYERTKPIGGIVHVVTGGGGALLYPVGKSDFTFFALSEFHFLHLKVGPSAIEVKAISLVGKTIDSFSLKK